MSDEDQKKKKFHFFKRVLLSIVDISAYSIFIREPLSKAIKYFLILVLLLNILPFVFFCRTFQVEINEFKNWLSDNLPKIWIKDGVIYCEGEQPVELLYKDHVKIIIDTKDQIKRIDPECEACILINSRKISIKFVQANQQSFYIPEELSLEINQETLNKFEKRLFFMVVPITAVIMYLVPLVKKALEIIFFSLLLSTIYSIYCMTKKIQAPSRLMELFSVGIYGITASALVEFLIGLSGFYFDYLFLIYYGVYIFYLMRVFKEVLLKAPSMTDNSLNGKL